MNLELIFYLKHLSLDFSLNIFNSKIDVKVNVLLTTLEGKFPLMCSISLNTLMKTFRQSN